MFALPTTLAPPAFRFFSIYVDLVCNKWPPATKPTYLPSPQSGLWPLDLPTFLPPSWAQPPAARPTYLPSDVVVFDAERVEEELAALLRRGVEAERRHGVGSMSARRLHDEQGDLDWNTRKPTYLPFTPSGAASGRADLPSYLRASRGLRPRDLPTYLLQVTQ